MTDIIDPNLSDLASRNAGLGASNSTTFSILNGINIQGGTLPLPHNTDTQGLIFFTRPCLNLTYNNVSDIRTMMYLTNTDKSSMGNAIRCMLNPPNIEGFAANGDSYRSNIINDKTPFIPLLSNTILSLSGWPDLVPYTYTSTAGIGSEQVSWVDGRSGICNTFDLTGSFANMEGDPITALFTTWVEYAQRVFEGSMSPFPINIVENRVDYQTRIYRLVLDRTKTFVQKISATGASFPIIAPIGAAMNFNAGTQFNDSNNQITIPFRCMGAMYNDPILVAEFNKIVQIYNSDMDDDSRPSNMVKLEGEVKHNIPKKMIMNYKAYPRIADNMELEWWASKQDYDVLIKELGLLDTTTATTTP